MPAPDPALRTILVFDDGESTTLLASRTMLARIAADYICECGMMLSTESDGGILRCLNAGCQHYNIEFCVPTVPLVEA